MKDASAFRWRIDLDLFRESAGYIVKNPGVDLLTQHPSSSFEGETLFIGGTKSPYIQHAYHSTIYDYFPQAQVEMMEGASHYLHHENPKLFLSILESFLKE